MQFRLSSVESIHQKQKVPTMMRGIKKGLSQRRLSSFSFQSSDPDTASSAPDKSHHNGNVVKSTAEARRRAYRKKSSLLSSVSSNSSDLVVDILPIDPDTQELAIKAAEEKKSEFRESLPKSLLMDYDTRDIVAPFRRDEVSCSHIQNMGHELHCSILAFIFVNVSRVPC